MLEFIGFIIKLVFGGLLGGICNYNRMDDDQEVSSIYTGAIIGIVGTISTSFAKSLGAEISGILMGFMILSSLIIANTIIKEMNGKIGTREVFALIIGWFTGVGSILHGILIVLFLIFFLSRFTENKNQETI